MITFQKHFLLYSLLFICRLAIGQTFTDINAPIIGVSNGAVNWVDYDGDGDLDFFVVGTDLNSLEYVSGLYQNNSGDFELVDSGLTNIVSTITVSSWADYDDDGDQDVIVGSRIFNNDNGIFTDIEADLEVLIQGSVDWADYDNDGDVDLLITGSKLIGQQYQSIVYRNDNGLFVNMEANLQGIWAGSGELADFDNDGDIDIMLSGQTSNSGEPHVIKIYSNENNVFNEIISLLGVGAGSSSLGDFDNDGDLDLLVSGNRNSSGVILPITILYENIEGELIDTGITFPNLTQSFVGWVDYNQDGNLDIMLTGSNENGKSTTSIFENENEGAFVEHTTNIINIQDGYFDWGDYDGDNLLDLIISGTDNNSGFSFNTKIYKQDFITPPSFLIDREEVFLNEDFESTEEISVTAINQVESMYTITPASVDFSDVSIDSETGLVTVEALENMYGEQLFTITATDVSNSENTFSKDFVLSVSPINDAPVITNLTSNLFVIENSSIELALQDLIVEDVDNLYPDDFELTSFSGSNYIVSENLITPDENFVGNLIVPVTVFDGGINSEVFNVIISVNADLTFTLDKLNIVVDEDFQDDQQVLVIANSNLDVTYSITPQSVDFCSFTFNTETGRLNIQSLPDLFGEQTFVITAKNNKQPYDDVSNEILLKINPINDAPEILGLVSEISIFKDSSVTLELENLRIADVDNIVPDDISLEILNGSNYTILNNRITPKINFIGNLLVPIKVSDGSLNSEEISIPIVVLKNNDLDIWPGNDLFVWYQNESKNYFNIEFRDNIGTYELRIYAMNGKLVYSDFNDNKSLNRIDLSTLPKGVYVVRVSSGNRFGLQKIIVD